MGKSWLVVFLIVLFSVTFVSAIYDSYYETIVSTFDGKEESLSSITNVVEADSNINDVIISNLEKPNYEGYIVQLKEKSILEKKAELEKKTEENEKYIEEHPIISTITLRIFFSLKKEDVPKRVDEHKEKVEREIQDTKGEISRKINKQISTKTDDTSVKNLGEFKNVFNGIALDISDKEAEEIKQMPEVEEVYPNLEVHTTLMDSVPLINADDVWEMKDDQGRDITGEDMKIAIIDTGVDYTHGDLGESIFQERALEKITNGPIDFFLSREHKPWTIDQQMRIEENKIVYYSANKLYIYSFETNQTVEIDAFSENLKIVRLALKNDILTYFASTSDLTTSLYYYDLDTRVHEKILQDYTDVDIGFLSVEDNKIIYGLGFFENLTLVSNIYVYDIHTKESIQVAENSEFIYNPVVSDGKIAYSVPSSNCYDNVVLYDLATREETFIRPPDVGPVLDFQGDEILYVDCSKTNPDRQWRHYHIYNINTGESIPLLYDVGVIRDSKVDTLNSRSVLGWKNKGAIGEDIVFFSKNFNANKIIAYDRLLDRYAQINNFKITGAIDAVGNKVCFLSSDLHIYCHDYDSNYDYPLSKVEFNDKVIGGYDFVNFDNDPMDDHGHGTHVAATAAGNGVLKGVAPDAEILAYKVLDSSGSGSFSGILAAIEKAVEEGSDIISMSLGGECRGGYNKNCGPNDPISQAVDTAVDSGVVVVIAAGNSGPSSSTIGTPGTARKVITVGATYKKGYPEGTRWDSNPVVDQITRFSSRGPVVGENFGLVKPDVVAPGAIICAAQYDSAWQDSQCLDEEHTAISGTSMATPHVAGAVALIKQAHPDWNPKEIKMALRNTAVDIDEGPNVQGAGRIDIFETVNSEKPPVVEIETGGLIGESIDIIGSAYGGGFESYTLYYGVGENPNEWIELATSTEPVERGVLHADFDTSVLENGIYFMKLIVRSSFGLQSEDKTIFKIFRCDECLEGWPVKIDTTFLITKPVAADIIGDENKELIVSNFFNPYGEVYVFYHNGSIVTGWPKRVGRFVTSPAVADLNGDGILEIIFSETASSSHFPNGKIHVLESDGGYLEGWPVVLNGTILQECSVSIGDIDGDGMLEVMSGTGGTFSPGGCDNPSCYINYNRIYALNSDGSIVKGWPIEMSSGFNPRSTPVLVDLDGNNDLEIVFGGILAQVPHDEGIVQTFHHDGTEVEEFSFVNDVWNWAIVAGDVNNDGEIEIFTHGYKIDESGKPMPDWQTQQEVISYLALADVDGDQRAEIIYGNIFGEVYVVDYNGIPLEGWPVSTVPGDIVDGNPIVGDIDGDGDVEILIGSHKSTKIYSWHHDGSIVKGFPKETGTNNKNLMLDDLNNDGNLDLISLGKNGNIFVFDLGVPIGKLEWSQFQFDEKHTGCYNCELCVDSDGGRNYSLKGTATGIENGRKVTSTDGCRYDGKTLAEVYCDGSELKVEQYVCSGRCEDGACINQENEMCNDTDGGMEFDEYGEVYINGTLRGKDVCGDWANSNLLEKYCDENDNYAVQYYNCVAGCEDGKCKEDEFGCDVIKKENSCYDYGDDVKVASGESFETRNNYVRVKLVEYTDCVSENCIRETPYVKLEISEKCGWNEEVCSSQIVYLDLYGEEIKEIEENINLQIDKVNLDYNIAYLKILEYDPCRDTDGGVDFYNYGEVFINGTRRGIDVCGDWANSNLLEKYCRGEDYAVEYYNCSSGCIDGACIREEKIKCVDTDGGKKEFVAGKTIIGKNVYYDVCVDSEYVASSEVVEYYCSYDGKTEFIKKDVIFCEKGCLDGACIGDGDDGTEGGGGGGTSVSVEEVESGTVTITGSVISSIRKFFEKIF